MSRFDHRRVLGRYGRRALAVLIVGAIGLIGTGTAGAATPQAPSSDPFYRAPVPLPDVAPGTVLATRAVTISGLGIALSAVHAYQLLYTSTNQADQSVADVTTVIIPNKASTDSPRPLVSYQVAEDALTELCAPSYELAVGDEVEEPLIGAALEQGWVVAVPDYEGENSEWTAGIQAGHAVLDGIRAAESYRPDGLSAATPVGLWGYSGGGQASAFTSEVQPSYAPQVHLVGVAEGGVPPNVRGVAAKIDGGPFSGIYLGAAVGLARAYPELQTLFNARGKQLERSIGTQCIDEFVAEYPFQRIETYTVGNVNPLNVPFLQKIVAQDALGQAKPEAPIFLYVSTNDELIPGADVDALVAKYCSEGVRITYVKDILSEHISLAITGAGQALTYLEGRFAGQPAPDNCSSPGGTVVASTLADPTALLAFASAVAGLTTLFF